MGSFPDVCCYRKENIVEDYPVQIYNKIENSENAYYLTQPNYSSLIFLQIRIKRYLSHKNYKTNQIINSKFFNGQNNTKTSSNKTYTHNLITNPIISGPLQKESTSKFNPNLLRITTENENIDENQNNQRNINEIDIKKDDENLLLPKIILNIGTKMFNDNLFLQQKINNMNSNRDPRNSPFDGKRKKYPIIYNNEFSYEGEWKNGKIDGKGILIKKDVYKFIGEFIEDKISGFGKFLYESGEEYIGYWEENKANGLGIYNKGFASYKGWWKNDKQNGFGIEKFPKLEYVGEFLNGNKDGYCIMNIKDGIYKGQMKDGNMNGIGSFTFKDKRKYEGEFVNNKMEGCGILTWPDGKVFAGKFKDDFEDGFGVYYTSKKIYIGVWHNMLLEGETIVIEGDKRRKQLMEQGKCVKNLSQNYEIYFEKYVDDIIKLKDFYVIK